MATESEAHFQSQCSWLREFQQRDDRTPGYCLVDDLKRARQVKLLKKSRAKATSASESAAAIKAATESKGTTGVRQLERETAATNNKELATAESHIEELQETNTQMLKATEPISRQQQLDRINSSKPHERAAAMQELQSFQQDALNCIWYCTGLEIDLFSTSPTATARYTVKAAVKAFTYMQNHCQTVAGTCTDCLKKIITELEVEATGTTAIAYAAGATTTAGTYTDYIKKIITELEDEVDYQECNQEYTSSQICSFRYFS